ncbi:ATP-binding protein [Actinomyces sp. S4-C9]|uniref:ATP-binding protein n=1 Tax=Actinomyces sp. S4-C9 TaxID=1219581 RepID=UPI000B107F91|nr:ATP-binding protein [Actinomyces sp. S4-C9]
MRFGLGMGMSISKSIVDDHDGSLSIASVPGRTTISVVLPVAGPDVEKLLLENSGNEE